MITVFHDLRFAVRSFRRDPAVALIAVLSLGAGVMATATIFSVVYTVLLAPPAYRDSGKLAVLWETNRAKGVNRSPVAPATFNDWRRMARSFERLELVAPGSAVTITGRGAPERANIQYATAGLFSLLGVDPVMGRFLQDEAAGSNAIVISYGFWRRHFASDAGVIGSKIVVNGAARSVAGVLPERFSLFDPATDLWLPIAAPDERTEDRTFRSWLIAVGRLNRDATLQTAQAEMDVLARGIAASYPASNKDWGIRVESIQEAQFGSWKGILSLLSGAVLALLLIACANVSNLFLGRLARRQRELLVRATLGATRFRLIRQVLVEGLVIGAAGCVVGVLLTGWGISLFTALAPPYFPLLNSVAVHTPVLLFALAISLCSGLGLAIVPAVLASRVSIIHSELRSGARVRLGHAAYRNGFAIAQIALCLVLLLTAGLMIRSAVLLMDLDPGFQPGRVITMQTFLTGPRYVQTQTDGVHIAGEVDRFYSALLDNVKTVPGIEAAAIVSWLPQMGYNTGRRERTLHIGAGSDKIISAAFNTASAEYFKTLRIRLLAGREFTSQDNENAPWIAVVNQAFAQQYWPQQNPIGQQLAIEGEQVRTIVGIVGDVRQVSPEIPAAPEIFVPFTQQPRVASGHGYQNRVHMNIVVRSAGDSNSTVAAIRGIAVKLDGTQPIFAVRTMSEVISDATSFRRLHTTLLALAAAVALFLAAIGIYGTISQTVLDRTAEIGLRIAVGANGADIWRLVASQTLKLMAAGIGCGLVAAEALRSVVITYLFGIGGRDPLTISGVCGLLAVVAAVSIWSPAIRAIRTDPVQTLREE